jgi:AcrR family transcriptional regulator
LRDRPNAREAILDAAEAVVLKAGAAHLRLDAVADKAGVSKGGLLYHFPSKEALLEAMITRLLRRFEEELQQTAATLPEGPSRALKAYVAAGLKEDEILQRVRAALLAAAANEPKLLAPMRDYYRQWFAGLAASRHPERASIVSLATEGLWVLELLGLSPLSPAQRERVVAELLRLAEEAT